jgi:chromosome segregation ATPase
VQVELASHEDSHATIATLQRSKSELEEDLRASAAKTAQLDDLKAQIDEMHSLKDRITDQKRELDEANERNEKLGETNDQLASDCIRYAAELENSAAKIDTVQTAAEKQDRELCAAKQNFVEAEGAIKQLQQQFAEAEGTVSTMQQRQDQMSRVCCV